MSHKYTSIVQTDIFKNDFGIDLDFEKIFAESDFEENLEFLNFLLEHRYVVKTSDSKPRMPKGIVNYENISYPKERFVIKDGSIYESKTETSKYWNELEWTLKVKGQ